MKKSEIAKNKAKKDNAYKEVLDAIRKRDGVIRPQTLVRDAESKRHPMHGEFEWDNSKGGHYWRVHQARNIINSIVVDVMDVGMQAYEVVIPVQNGERKGYYPIQEIMSDDDLRGQVVKRAVSFIKHWQAKYNSYKELDGLINETKLKKLSMAG